MKTNQSNEKSLKSANKTLAKETTDNKKVIEELKVKLKEATERENIAQKVIEEKRKEIEELEKNLDFSSKLYRELKDIVLKHNTLPFYKKFKKIKFN